MKKYEEPNNKIVIFFLISIAIFTYMGREKIFKSLGNTFNNNYTIAYDYDSTIVYKPVEEVIPEVKAEFIEPIKPDTTSVKKVNKKEVVQDSKKIITNSQTDTTQKHVVISEDNVTKDDLPLLEEEDEEKVIVDTQNKIVEAETTESKKKKFRLFKKRNL